MATAAVARRQEMVGWHQSHGRAFSLKTAPMCPTHTALNEEGQRDSFVPRSRTLHGIREKLHGKAGRVTHSSLIPLLC